MGHRTGNTERKNNCEDTIRTDKQGKAKRWLPGLLTFWALRSLAVCGSAFEELRETAKSAGHFNQAHTIVAIRLRVPVSLEIARLHASTREELGKNTGVKGQMAGRRGVGRGRGDMRIERPKSRAVNRLTSPTASLFM